MKIIIVILKFGCMTEKDNKQSEIDGKKMRRENLV